MPFTCWDVPDFKGAEIKSEAEQKSELMEDGVKKDKVELINIQTEVTNQK